MLENSIHSGYERTMNFKNICISSSFVVENEGSVYILRNFFLIIRKYNIKNFFYVHNF